MALCLHAGHTRVADSRGVRSLWWEIEPVTGIETDVTPWCMECDRAVDAEEDLVMRVLVFPVSISRLIGPCLWGEPFFAKGFFGHCPLGPVHR